MAKPILGYSQQGVFNPENIPANAKSWLRNYCYEIQYAIDNNIETSEENREAWNNLRNGAGLTPRSTRTVSQLLTTYWNQRPYYNALCPYDEEEGELSVTGCVATAMAQVLTHTHPKITQNTEQCQPTLKTLHTTGTTCRTIYRKKVQAQK